MAKNKAEESKDTLKSGQEPGENGSKADAQVETDQEIMEQEEGSEDADKSADLKEEEAVFLKNELQESKDKYLRLYSEFENFRRRTAKERIELIKTAGEEVLTALLPVMDDFERAKKSIDGQEVNASVKEGVDLIYNKLSKILEQKGVKQMEVERGSDFNPEFHEAVTQFPAPEESLKGKVVDVLEKGYLLGDKVIRFAKVVTGA